MDRRSLLKTAGGIGVTASAAGAGVLATSGSAAAAEIGTFDLTDSSITTDDGTITGFSVEPEISIQYDGLDQEAGVIVMQFGVYNPDGSPAAISTGVEANNSNLSRDVSEYDSLDTRAGEYTYDLPAIDVLANSDWEPSDFEADAEGSTEDTTVEFYAYFGIRPAGGGVPMDPPGLVTETGTVTVSVTNEQATGATGVEGDTGLSGENQES